MKKHVIIPLLLALLSGCKEDIDGKYERQFYRSLVQDYETTDSLSVKFDRYYNAYMIIHHRDELIAKRTNEYKYNLLCVKNNDMSFNMETVFITMNAYTEAVCANDFVSIALVSDIDFDAVHPAGTSLADIVEFRTASPKRYIDSGYTEEYRYPDEREFDFYPHTFMYKWFWPVRARMSELTEYDLSMMKSGDGVLAAFRFIRRPAAAGEHGMTLTMTTDEGKAFTARFKAVFE